jgi:serine/threonine protein kinase/N-acetylneuraminic acid mutarotase
MTGLPLVGDEFAGYRTRAVLGRGGMSVVYQAENLRLSSIIALKVLAPELAADDVFRARFLEESRIAASLNHPNVIPIYDMGSQDDLLYIAMRYVSGTDLRQMIKKRGRILPATALFLLAQAARALDAAHRKGLVHRDVKPGNLLIERGSDEADPDHVYLADFGITKHAMSRSGLTSTGQFLGTIDYVAPEQIRGMSVLGLADQYSLGCVLYECLTGRVPFEKDLDAAIIWAHVEETPTMPTVLRPDLPPEVDEVFGRVLAKRPDERYGSCREFIEAARIALGIFGTGTESSLSYGVTSAGPQTGPPPGSRAGRPPEPFSWSNVASRPHPPAPGVDPVAPAAAAGAVGQSWGSQPSADQAGYGQPAAGRAGAGHSGGTVASHRREYGVAEPAKPDGPGGAPPSPREPRGPRGPRWYRQPRWIAVLAAVVLVVAGLGTWIGLSTSGTTAQTPAPGALMKALTQANQGSQATGLLPPSACTQDNRTHVTCAGPASGITTAVFQTYPSLTALYAAYTAKVSSLNSGQFKQNFSNCGTQAINGEVGWNRLPTHTSNYTVAQMTTGLVTDAQAAGRVFCNYTQGQEYMVWTQNDGNMLAYAYGPVHTDVWNWWVPVHLNIGLKTGTQSGWQLGTASLYATQQVGAAILDGKIWVAGGLTDSQDATPRTEYYDSTTGMWSEGPNLPVPLHHAMMVSYQNTVWVIGGFEPKGSEIIGVASDRVFRLNQAQTGWVEAPSLHHARGAGAAAVVGNKIVVVGGRNAGTPPAEVVPTEIFDGTSWHDAAGIPVPGDHLAAVSDGTYLYTVGGRRLEAASNTAAVQRFDPAANRWVQLKDAPGKVSDAGAAIIGGRIVVAGGESTGSVFSTVWAYDLASGTWSSLPNLAEPRHGMAVAAIGNTLYAIDGASQPGHNASTPTLQTLTVPTGPAQPAASWQLGTASLYATQQVGAAVDSNGRIWVAGGLTDAQNATPRTEYYDPTVNVWTPGPNLPVPLHHAMMVSYQNTVWVIGGFEPKGSEIIGVASDRVFRLNQAQTGWVEAPSLHHARGAGAAAVVGNKIVVVGGRNAGTPPAEVVPTEIFDGTSWHDAAGIPVPGDHLAAVSDGTYLYTVGGRRLEAASNTAAVQRFDPAANRWVQLKDAPGKVSDAGAAIIGGRIVVAGGESTGSVFSTVWAYDLASGTWSSLPNLAEPRHGMAVAAIGNTLYAIDGASQPGHNASTTTLQTLTFH